MNKTLLDPVLGQLGIEKNTLGGYEGIIFAIIIVIASVVVAKIVYWLVERYMKAFAAKTKSDIDDLILGIIHKPIYYIIILIGIQLAVSYVTVSTEFEDISYRLISIAVILLGAWVIARIMDAILLSVGKKIATKTKTTVDDEAIPFLSKVLKFTIYLLAFIIVLDQFGIEITPLVASLGIAGFAIGFAAKDTISNLLAGFFILTDRPFARGDRIKIKGYLGEVVDIGLRTTKIKTLDHTYVIIPNAGIVSNEVINYTLPDVKIKVKIPIGVAYGTDPDKVKRIIIDVTKRIDEVMKDPKPVVYFTEFGESSLNFLLIFWVPDFRKKLVAVDKINSEINKEFEKTGIEIPFPCRTIYMRKE
ncbi:MAG TPA: mechanosensitive ion channel family protein [Candidatus Altiarchaeales archaeon]|nr:mechanosensitive ion channel family protein [Candidatus Altiarchaeales archaeon]